MTTVWGAARGARARFMFALGTKAFAPTRMRAKSAALGNMVAATGKRFGAEQGQNLVLQIRAR